MQEIYDIRIGYREAGRDLDRLRLGHHGHDTRGLVHDLVRRCYSAGCRAEGFGSANYLGLVEADQPAASAEAVGIAEVVEFGAAADPVQQVVVPFACWIWAGGSTQGSRRHRDSCRCWRG